MQAQLTEVQNSSLIAADAYDRSTETLEIKFKNGDIWRYAGVDPLSAARYGLAESKGKYFLAFIKPNIAGVKVTS